MINLSQLKDNPEYKKKVVIATIIFTILVVGILAFIISKSSNEEKKSNTVNKENNIEGNHIMGDSVAVESTDKNFLYSQESESQKNADDIIANGINGGGETTPNGGSNSSDDDLNAYMKQRQNSIDKMNSGGNSRPISSSSGGRRNYNPNGNSSDWTSVRTEKNISGSTYSYPQNNDIDNYERVSNTRNIPSSSPPSQQNNTLASNISQETPSISDEKERKRLMLRTGKKDITNSSQIKINIDGTQYVKNGQNVKLKLMQDAVIANNFIPKYSIVYGVAHFGDGRVNIRVNSVKLKDNIIACNLEGYGTDGNQGVAVNLEAISGISDVARNEINREISSITRTRVGNIVTSLFRSSNRNEIKVKLLNNHNLIFLQQ